MDARRPLIAACAMLSALALLQLPGIAAKADPSVGDFFSNGNFILGARYRFEHVEQDGFANDANANTVRVPRDSKRGRCGTCKV